MAHYAFLDNNNVVVEVIVGIDENDLIDGLKPEDWYESFRKLKCVRTSYNSKIRKNFAGIGFTYDAELDAFIPPKLFDSWIFNENSCTWEAPKPMPQNDGVWIWDEELGDWVNAETL